MTIEQLKNELENTHNYNKQYLNVLTRLQLMKIANREGITHIIGE